MRHLSSDDRALQSYPLKLKVTTFPKGLCFKYVYISNYNIMRCFMPGPECLYNHHVLTNIISRDSFSSFCEYVSHSQEILFWCNSSSCWFNHRLSISIKMAVLRISLIHTRTSLLHTEIRRYFNNIPEQ